MTEPAMISSHRSANSMPHRQRGITTLAVTLILLVIVTVMVLFSTSIGFFEQKTTTNENRSRISQQAAEYART
jgi:Tfp pilus assembly protein PilX